ncbi:hypothetical protein ABFS83_14G159100 [Erythranthe nasuta]
MGDDNSMDDDNLMDVNLMDLDLNQEPTDQPLRRVERYGSLLNELETAHGRIEERIRQLEAVSARARQRQRWRQSRNSPEVSYTPVETMVDVGQSAAPNENGNTLAIVERTAERGKGCKRDSSHLVAQALEIDSDAKKKFDKESGSFYDCNICLEMANEPVLTCCGHLFCWPCFFQVSKIDSSTASNPSKECPVCKGEVSDTTVIPIYGNGGAHESAVCETESGLKIPPRPKARRVESVRQQRIAQGLSHVPVAEALRRIRISIGATGNRAQPNSETSGGPRIRMHQVSRVLSESAASLSSLSSALSNAERLVEDLETVINNRLLQNETRAFLADVINNPSARAVQTNNEAPNSTPDSNGGATAAPSSSSSSVRRRSLLSRNLDLDSRDARESRRRRLN